MKKLLSVATATILAAGFAMPLNAAPMFVPKPELARADVIQNVNYYHHRHYRPYYYAHGHYRPYYYARGHYRPYYPGYYGYRYPSYKPHSGDFMF